MRILFEEVTEREEWVNNTMSREYVTVVYHYCFRCAVRLLIEGYTIHPVAVDCGETHCYECRKEIPAAGSAKPS